MKAFALSPIAATLIAASYLPVSYAQEAEQNKATDEPETEQILILGTRRPGRSVVQSNVPVDLIDEDTLNAGGFNDISRQLQNVVPSFNFYQPSLVDGTEHIKPASLRGLAPDQTLVLLNGRRFHTSALLNLNGTSGRGSVSVDLNAIPSAAIKRIEILRDGAAAQYGSDAIAGVINIITKDAAEGGSVTVSAGSYFTELDGVPELTGILTDEQGNIVPNENGANRVTGIYGDDINRNDGENINFTANTGLALGDDGYINITGEIANANRTNRGGYDDGDTYPLTADGNFDQRELTVNRDRFNFGSPDTESYTLLANAGYYLNSKAELYSTLTFQDKESVTGAFFREAADEGLFIQDIYPNGFTPQILAEIQDWSVLAGVKGSSEHWDYNASVVTGSNEVDYTTYNTANPTYLSQTPTQFYGGQLANQQTTFSFDASRFIDIDGLFSPLSFALGAEYRIDEFEISSGDEAAYTNIQAIDENGNPVVDETGNPVYQSDRLFAQGALYFSDAARVDEDRDSYAFYIDLDADITQQWNITLAGRYEDYSDFGSTSNGKLATRYMFSDTFSVRGSVSTGFRAPSLQQQFYTSVSTNFINGVAYEVGTISSTSTAAQALGGSQLDAEESTNVSLGFTWSPIERLTITADAYRIDIDDRVVLSETLGDSDDEAAIVTQVFNANNIEGVGAVRFFINGVNSRTEGVDVVANYTIDDIAEGSLNLSMGANYNETEVSEVIATAGPADLFAPESLFARRERSRLENAAPKTKANITANWQGEKVSLLLRGNYFGEVTQPGSTQTGDVTVDTAFIVDTEVGYFITEDLQLKLGVNNLFDKYPQSAVITDAPDVGQFDYVIPYPNFSPYGFQGRYAYGKLTYSF
ncbi:TonB-dependent receptor plug domain-containing protein [Salinimonas sediminis]|uniref:TonB-dependent receptor n=1 Tax=Salinimonas sediminis TaxID=2303538 RepID=A0A346NNL5_9ALTE|nr:TonB-dependent receptor [Salinimonas sediminis]AXR07122.1 TonB-dependent receptor [Salinimonas sediminis]